MTHILLLSLLTLILIYISLYDLQTYRIPNSASLAVAILGGVWMNLEDHPLLFTSSILVSFIISILILFFLFRLLGRPTPMGGGDIKLMLASFLWLSPTAESVALFFILAGFFGVITAAVKRTRGPFPFAPSISAALLCVLSLTRA